MPSSAREPTAQFSRHQSGTGGFGYDPVFYFTELHKSFAELTREEKNQHSHRGKAFRRLLALLPQLT